MSDAIIKKVESKYLKAETADVKVGDNVDVHCRIIEGDKERIQVFSGVVIAIKGGGINQRITVRRIVANEGVERIFPTHSPKVAKIDVKRSAHTRRAKLFYLRERLGKSRRLRDQRRGLDSAQVAETTTAPAAGAQS
jgi:large subunit ribosomal protein L19